jgi:formylglycine-generating enzyme required for sulfatase activity/serine/threonine protein kinase
MRYGLLKSIAQALLQIPGLDRIGRGIVLIAHHAAPPIWAHWINGRDEADRKAELLAIARVAPEDLRQQIATILQEVAPDRPSEVREVLASYLTAIPPTIRQSLQPMDLAAGTLAQDVALRQPEDLVRFLPTRMPRLKLGDRPLPGVDLELVELLGVGGFGEVWKARNPHFDGMPPVALKFCLDGMSRDRLLRHEASLLNQVMRQGKHPGIVPLLRTYLTADPPCLEYEYVEGGDLTALMNRWRKLEAQTTVNLANKVMIRLAETVAFAHRLTPPIVHRDLKPANILVQQMENGKVLFRITDFGIGGVAAQQAIVETTHLGGQGVQFLTSVMRGAFTPLYASPQQMRGEPPDPRDDVYSLGVIWYQLLTRDPAMARPGGTHWADRLSSQGLAEPLIALLAACFEDNPQDRPVNAAALAEQLTTFMKGKAGSGAPVSGILLRGEAGQEAQRTLQQVADIHQKARALADDEHNYAEAAKLLEKVPEHLRDAQLYGAIRQNRDRVAQLDLEVHDAVHVSRLADFQSKIAELLQLQPERTDLIRLLEEMPNEKELPPRIINSIGMELALIPRGSFLMGSPDTEPGRMPQEGPLHRVLILTPFYLGIYPVTQAEYEAVMDFQAAQFAPDYGWGPDHPVKNVSWDDAVTFCRKLSALPAEKEAGRTYRLPTEAEWEYACRAGTTTPFGFDWGAALSSQQANFNGNYPYGAAVQGPYRKMTTPVGSFAPNAFGLYDMHGNVWEWCADWYEEGYYHHSPAESPSGPAEGFFRVLRGGAWSSKGKYCRSAFRNKGKPGRRVHSVPIVGFRVVAQIHTEKVDK